MTNHCLTAIELPADYAPADGCLAGRTVLVTGAGDGIGRAVALTAARRGATVVLAGKTVRKLENVYDTIVAAGGAAPALYPINLEGATPSDYAELATLIADEFDGLHGLVHCAALLQGLTALANYSPETWYRTLQINLNAPFLLTQALLPQLAAAGRAAIVFSDDGGALERAYWGAYAVAKAGQRALLRLLAEELERNTDVRVGAVDPGPTRTRLRQRVRPLVDPGWALPERVALGYLYLLDPDAGDAELRGAIVRLPAGV